MRCAGVDIFEGSKLVFEWRPAEGVADLLRLDIRDRDRGERPALTGEADDQRGSNRDGEQRSPVDSIT
jgi:hypothetical protein